MTRLFKVNTPETALVARIESKFWDIDRIDFEQGTVDINLGGVVRKDVPMTEVVIHIIEGHVEYPEDRR